MREINLKYCHENFESGYDFRNYLAGGLGDGQFKVHKKMQKNLVILLKKIIKFFYDFKE